MSFEFNDHSRFSGSHSYLSASQNAWVNYDDKHFIEVFENKAAAERGTKLHALAEQLIRMGIRLEDNEQTFNMYVNDAIGYHMKPEVVLYYSPNAFCTTDAIYFNEREKFLRIHDLKTGTHPVTFTQLYVYAAYFCLEYDLAPGDLNYELRYYQNNDIIIDDNVNIDEVAHIADTIQHYDKLINQLRDISD